MPPHDPAAFISYSREDSEFALRLAQDLKAAGAHVWLDQLDILPGRPWDNAIEQALGQAVQMLIVLSPSSAKSENVRNEISYALEQGKIIVPVLYQDCVVPLQLQRTQRIDFRADYARGLHHLLQHLHVVAPDPAVLEKAAEGDAQRQAAWQAREIEAQRMREKTRLQQDGKQWQKPVAIAGAVFAAVALIVGLTVYIVRPGPGPGPGPQPVPVPQPVPNPQPTPQPNPPAPTPAPVPTPKPISGADPIIGCYKWFNGAPVMIYSNHTIVGGPFTGTWQLVDAAHRTYTFLWPQPSVDAVAVSPDQQSLNGANQYGFVLTGNRTAGSSGLVGTWSAVSGVPMTLNVNANGTYSAVSSAGTFKGTWQPSGLPGGYVMTSVDRPKDRVTLTPDNSSVSGANQFGISISGTRTEPCTIN